MNLKQLSISHKKDLIYTFNVLREKVKDHSDLIFIEKDKDLQFVVKDLDPESNFKFNISKQEQREGKVYYHYSFSPSSVSSNNSTTLFGLKEAVITHFGNWISFLNQHNLTLNIHPEDNVFNHYIEEFHSKFKLEEDDADTVPFSTEKQLLIYRFLEQSIILLKAEKNEESENLVEEAEKVQEELGRLSKNELIFKFAQFYANLRIFSFKIFEKVISKGMDYGYNRMFDNIFELGG